MLGELAGAEIARKEFALSGILTSAVLTAAATSNASLDGGFSQRLEAAVSAAGSAQTDFVPETADVIGSSFASTGGGEMVGVGSAYGAALTTISASASTSLIGGAVGGSTLSIMGSAQADYIGSTVSATSFDMMAGGVFGGIGGAEAFGSFSSTGATLTAFLGYQNLPPADEVVQRLSEVHVVQRPAESRAALWR